ncbi:hypothetical protein LJR219_001875 [Phenylobacterium sp. LjRoot219]|uniref:glycosyltransferase family 9 protein n=1 Tax=Phenylobacterium sp. LjRoot219 TaxID=3342283 RepID=UPI003ED14FF7
MDEAEGLFRRAAEAQRFGRYAEAVTLYREVLARTPGRPEAEQNLCLALLGAGDLGAGFRRYDVRFDRDLGRVAKPALSFPEWRGEPVADRSILIWMEQGFGDQIMFARFALVLTAMGADVSILTPPALTRLFRSLPARIIEASGEVTIPRHDYWIMPGSIPGLLGVTEQTLPRGPYLPGAAGGAGVGVAWRGDARHPTNPARSLPPEHRDDLLSLPGAVSLLPEDTGAADFAETAALIRSLARVITVDTSIAHLAGAMGKPTWVLLMAENCCWRWQGGREDSPWYGSVRLFRQPAPGDWAAVLDAVRAALEAEPA